MNGEISLLVAANDGCITAIDDPKHSTEEDRFIILGCSSKAKLLIACHCYRDSDQVIRIIPARKAAANERNQYYESL